MSVPDSVARRRWLAITGVRVAGVGGALLGLVLLGRAQTLAPQVIGVALVLSAMLMMMVVPASLARRWRSPKR
ncbi:hypothetical protein Q5H91_09020 [Sphingomonas sp. KR1UV-12]|uniref:Uncharacterized protein n=1 Tax=Sphingomonas aurea TaxID=3063994 RepID=A0ABT9EL54_9SPHN|nr:hypothetical protein [Sphingomonas sp. KR1UV-12]MDP1027353.1 hypothetical protein [Sphingomonas sp. KR1UV-12]